jgi:hypothetical protein
MESWVIINVFENPDAAMCNWTANRGSGIIKKKTGD